ncbi:MAG: response regulator [Bacteroides sp.]|nr:response regulator [Bacteroides sp.]MCM1390298.1 response regulator [Bacteroides sp.]
MSRIKLFTALILLNLSCVLPAANYRFSRIEAEDGLSHNKVNALFKDRDGFLWIGTVTGLNRYDGYNIKTFREIPGDSTSMKYNHINDIQQDPRGYIWIKAGDAYVKYDPRTEAFDNNPIDTFRRMGINTIPQSIYIADGCIWFYVADNGLYCFSTGEATKVEGIADNGHSVNDIAGIPRTGGAAVLDSYGMLYFVNQNSEIVNSDNRINTETGNQPVELKMTADNNGRIWIYGDKGLWVYNTHTNSWDDAPLKSGKNAPIVRAVAQDRSGNLWLGLDNDGIIVIDRAGNMERIVTNPADPDGLGNNSITTITADDDGNVWIGTQKKGVSAYNESEFKFGLVPLEDVNCAAPGDDNTCWIGTDSDGLKLLDRSTGKITSYPDAADGAKPAPITALTPSADGGIWIGTYNGGLKKFKNGKFSHYGKDQGIASENVWAILENPDNTIWVGTLGKGLQLMNPATREIKTFTLGDSGLETDFIISLCHGDNGKTYIGTTVGLFVYDPATGEITRFNNSCRDGENYYVSQVLYDSRGLLWIANDRELNVYDPAKGTIYEIPLSRHSSVSYVLGLIEDNNGKIWVAIDGAVTAVNVAKNPDGEGYLFRNHIYTSSDGLQNAAYNQRSLAKMKNGDIVIGGPYGLSYVSPANIRYNMISPDILFTSLYLGNTEIKTGQKYDGRVILEKSINHSDKITLNHRQNSFTIGFAANNYVQPGSTSYYYKLDGIDEDWIECLHGVHHATFTNLSPGTYTLHVKAVNNDGVESSIERSIEITVTPPFWSTIWAWIIYIVLIALAAWLLYRAMKRAENRRIQEVKKAEYAKKQEELARMKDKFFTNVSHELRTPLTLIISPVESLLKESTDHAIKDRLQIVHGNAKRLLTLVNQLLDFRKNEEDSLKYTGITGDVINFIRNILDSFVAQAEHKEITLSFDSSVQRLDMEYDEDKLNKIVSNLLSNAIKFTPRGGRINLSINVDGAKLLISVADNGCGIDDDEKELIFQRYYQSRNSKGSDGETGTGIGLNLVSEYVGLHEGSITVTDTPGGGSTFTVGIPIKTPAATTDPKPLNGNADPAEAQEKPVVLVVDDNYDMVNFLKTELSSDYTVINASDGLQAIDMLKEHHVDAILSDLMMPRMDGIELCRRVKSDKLTRNIPVIILTAKHDAGSELEGLTHGADDYVTKPFNNDVLKVKIRKLMERSDGKSSRRAPISPEPELIEITPLDEQFINKAKKYVEENISRSDLSVEELSRALGMSRVHLYKKILKLTEKTPIEFIRILRLKRAAQYLRESQLNISEIAYKLGFNNPKYFSRYFQEEYGMPPSEYQKREGR